jgi:hypothetical protein
MNSSPHTLGFRFEKAAGPGSTSPVGGLAMTKDRIVVGALASADLRLLGEGVSSIHAVIERSAEGLTVFDLASETGVRLNGKAVVTSSFQDGDLLEIAGFEIRCVRVETEVEAPIAVVSRPAALPSRPSFLSRSADPHHRNPQQAQEGPARAQPGAGPHPHRQRTGPVRGAA